MQEAVFSSSVDEARATGVSRAGVGHTIAAWFTKTLLNRVGRPLADTAFTLLFPADCRICNEPLVQESRLPVCQKCRETIHLLKYDRVLPAADFLGAKLDTTLAELPSPQPYGWLVIPVPLHSRKLRQRGFNQSELIARAAFKRQPLAALNRKCLVRQRETAPQAGLTRHQRRENIRGAFVVRDPAAVRGRDILLVDDVFTTGTKISECARILRRAGAASVYAATVARALKAGPNADSIGMEREIDRAA